MGRSDTIDLIELYRVAMPLITPWTTAYGIMSEQEMDDAIPEPYRKKYSVSNLRDGGLLPEIIQSAENDTRTFAEASVQAIQSLVFPMHGIRTG